MSQHWVMPPQSRPCPHGVSANGKAITTTASSNASPAIAPPAQSLLHAVREWIAAGAPLVPDHILADRKTTCASCPHWQPHAYAGLGRCTHCGCSSLKLHLATAACPIGRWSAYQPQPKEVITAT